MVPSMALPCDGSLLQRFQARPGFLFTQRSQANERSSLRFSRERLVSFPVVDRLGRCAHKQAELCSREAEALSHRSQTLGREARLAGRRCFGRDLRRLACSFSLASKICNLAFQFGNLSPLIGGCLSQWIDLGPDFSSCQTCDFIFYSCCKVCHSVPLRVGIPSLCDLERWGGGQARIDTDLHAASRRSASKAVSRLRTA